MAINRSYLGMKSKDYITEHFRLSEFLSTSLQEHFDKYETFPEMSFYGAQEVIRNIIILANRLQVVRDVFDSPIYILSGLRTPEHNALVGGAQNSQHLVGKAADIVARNIKPETVRRELVNWSGGLGSYETFTHLDIGPKRRW
jgi:uncharacterized protein YcbK (DUF882 family)